MRLRSLLFVPGDRPDRMTKALASGADALILDLEDAVAPAAKPAARGHVAAALRAPRSAVRLFVRINPLDGDLAADDLAAVLPARPDGIVLPKSEGGASVSALDALLSRVAWVVSRNSASSPSDGERDGAGEPTPSRSGDVAEVAILPIATETPSAVFGLGTYRGVSPRLCGLTWGAEDLPAAIGASTSRESDGRYTPPYEMVRALALFGAHAAGVPAIETVYPAFQDLDGLAASAARARRDGFTGMLAIHPRQVPVVNAAFMPSGDEIARARAVVAAFAAQPGAGALSLDGRMIDAPHLKLARAVLRQAGEG